MMQISSFFFANFKEVLDSFQKDIRKAGKKSVVVNNTLMGNKEFSTIYRSDGWIVFDINESMCEINVEGEVVHIRFKLKEIKAIRIYAGKRYAFWPIADIPYTVISEIFSQNKNIIDKKETERKRSTRNARKHWP